MGACVPGINAVILIDKGLVAVHLRPEGSGDVFRAVHDLSALVIQAQNTWSFLPCTAGNKRLLLHSWACSQSASHIVQIPDFIPLIGSKRSRMESCRWFTGTVPQPCLDFKRLPELGW